MYKRLAVLWALVLAAAAAGAEEARTLDWTDLVPDGGGLEPILEKYRVFELEDDDPRAADAFAAIQSYLQAAPVKPELDGQRVRLPGYAIALEGDGKIATEFLLVPYFGACIHVPPPPSNQIVHVRFQSGVRINALFDAVWVTGRLRTERVGSVLATAGYTMDASGVEPYQ